jgi:hypothetical protein
MPQQPNSAPNNGGSFWSTLPGIFTAMATLIGAIIGLITILNQIGWIGPPPLPTPSPPDVRPTNSPSPSLPPANTSAPPSSLPSSPTIVPAPTVVPAPNITAGNVATRVSEQQWNWTVFIRGSEDALDQVDCVEYTLHPTFPNPQQVVCERGTGSAAFPLSASGWGTFEIRIRVFMKDGRVHELTHNLQFLD